MSKIPVLLLISRRIDLRLLNDSPRWQRYHFYSLTALEYLEERHLPHVLQNALEKKIDRVGACYLLAHLGLAFHRYPVEFLTALLDVQASHPRLKIAFDRDLEYTVRSLQLLGPSRPEVTCLVDRLLHNRSAFSVDRKTSALLGCLS